MWRAQRDQGRRRGDLAGAGGPRGRLRSGSRGLRLRQQGVEVAGLEGVVAGRERGRVGEAQGGEQQGEADELDGAEFIVLPGIGRLQTA